MIAAAISPAGSGRALVTAGVLGRVTLFLSDDVLEETRRNLSRKHSAALSALDVFEEAFANQAVEPTVEIIQRAAELVAAKDAPILGGAIAAEADYLASYDRRHLLNAADRIHEAFGITVARPADIPGVAGESTRMQ